MEQNKYIEAEMFKHYQEKFEELGLILYDFDTEFHIKSADNDIAPYVHPFWVDCTVTKNIFDNLLETMRLGQRIEKEHTQIPFKIIAIDSELILYASGENIYKINLKIEDGHYIGTVTKQPRQVSLSYRTEKQPNLYMTVKANYSQGFNLAWEYEINATDETIIQQINKAVEVLEEQKIPDKIL